ncbi:MAG: ATP-binding protein [Polyangia bacterium]|jgi:signal transduction histidine kinase|nr:ATP-binding protein [Polyangia bacterium]
MKLSVSLKIFLGFIAVVVAFGAAAIFEIARSRRIQEDLRRLNQVYLRLNDVYRALDTRVTQLSELHRNSRDILKTSTDNRSRVHVTRYMPLVQEYRDKRLEEISRIARSGLSIDLPPSDRRFLLQMDEVVSLLSKDFAKEDKIYQEVFVKASESTTPEQMASGTQRMLREMAHSRKRLRQVATSLRQVLSKNLTASVRRTAQRMESTEAATAIYSMTLTIFALLVAMTMMLLAHRTLKPLLVLRQGARVIGRGDYGHRVSTRTRDEIGELAQEFNAMAEAIQERERRLIESERKAARSERLATVGRAAAQITHEVRNPLSAIQLNAEMLEEELTSLGGDAPAAGPGETGQPQAEIPSRPAPPEHALAEARTLLAAIQREIDRLTEVTESYLQFARLPRPRLEQEELGPVIEGLLSFHGAELEGCGIRTELLIEPLPPLHFDENQIRQVVLNLVRNAQQAMAGGGTLTIRARPGPERVELEISDTGEGMSEAQLKKIFDPFYTTKETGTGLGLAITSQILEEHGGSIRAESREGGGTRFLVTLPLEPPRGDEHEPAGAIEAKGSRDPGKESSETGTEHQDG